MNTVEQETTGSEIREEIPCAFCHGQGNDPYGLLSERSVCGACGGRGLVRVAVPHICCAFCGGSGSYKTFRCPVCDGAGVIPTPQGPTKACPSCAGLAFESSSGMVCLTCRGRGFLRVSAPQ
ncbi:MAG: hypothetical protein ACLQGP_23935 [Isosphaeraceae bacterium]